MACVNVQAEGMNLSTKYGPSGTLREGTGLPQNFDHRNLRGVEGRSLEKPPGLHQYGCAQTLVAAMRESQ